LAARINAREASKSICPQCGADVMITGFTTHSVQTHSYMRFDGLGPVQIASTLAAADRATCMLCDAELAVSPAELMRAA
jgi:hypothetical protein